jgi:hypothetical protein
MPESDAADTATLSGRPAIEVAVPRTHVRWTTKVVAGLFAAGVVVLVAVTLLRSGPDGTDVREMSAGQCYVETEVIQDHGRAVPFGKDSPCLDSSPRVVAVVHLPLGPYPGTNGLNQVVVDRCGGEQTYIIAPTPDTWAAGDRTVTCLHLP